MNSIEVTELSQYEEVIERGLETFVDVGSALLAIRDKKLYRKDYSTFEQYCRDRWGMSKPHATRLIQSAEVVGNLVPMGTAPVNERQARPLASLSPDEQVRVWQSVVETTPMELVTAAHVQKAVDEFKGNGKPHVSHNSGENEWYTPAEYIACARAVMGRIDVDPASSDLANETVKASMYFTKEDNGLDKFWAGKVWMNPPYSTELVRLFISKFVSHVEKGDISEGIVLVNNATETNWFNELISVAAAVVFPNGRIRFIDKNGNPSGAPLQGQAIIYTGDNAEKFMAEFGEFGWSAKVCREA